MNLLFIVFLSLHTAQYKFEFGVTHVGNIGEGNEEITRYITFCWNPGGSSALATTTTVEATAKPTTPQPSKNPTNFPIPEDIDGYELEDIGYEHDAETS